MSEIQPKMKYNKQRGLHIGARRTDGLGANAVLTPKPRPAPSARDAAVDKAVQRGLSVSSTSSKRSLKETS